jgi:hypothetical protein
MPIESSDRPCPECGSGLQVVYVTERRQVVSGAACPECGYLVSDGEGDSVDLGGGEYVLRKERPLTDADVRPALSTVPDEFRARARDGIDPGEVWLLLDAEDGSLVDIAAGETDED